MLFDNWLATPSLPPLSLQVQGNPPSRKSSWAKSQAHSQSNRSPILQQEDVVWSPHFEAAGSIGVLVGSE
ncbi:hypothetical protein ACJ73_01956 [Blastomyces percursus]|uniref:Uncharacterized protein n=1 Tax=Blastomyces percursus TaxID=1658174 RepID=A0A1J9QDQ5_9EURO|nr:hypothetical protein ACJ73_01956 [Blastomyces percursus]